MNKKILTIKPEKTPFIAYNLFVRFLVGIIVIVGLYFVYQVNLVISFVVLLAFLVFSYYAGTVSYRKEEYTIKDKKVIRKSGGIFSDAEQELNIKNITHLEVKKSLIDRKVFGVGSVIIESAGSQAAEVSMNSVKNPKEIFEVMEDKMKQTGFKIDRDEILEEDKPSAVAILLEISGFFAGLILFLPAVLSVSPFAIVPAIIAVLTVMVLRYYDLRNRKYNLLQGKIVAKRDFLTQSHTIVPMENLSDSNLEQNFLNKILGLYDLKLSCQGSGSEIKFKNIKKGRSFDEKIDKLIKSQEAVSLKTDQPKQTESQTEKENRQSGSKTKTRGLESIPEEFHSFKKDLSKAIIAPIIIAGLILSLFVLLFVLAWVYVWFLGGTLSLFSVLNFLSPFIFLAIAALFPLFSNFLSYFATDYSVKEQSIREEYNFLSTDIKEFSDDKITGIYLKESLIDRLLGTYTVHFWSIGSGEDIEFSGIKKNEELEKILKKKYNFNLESENHQTIPEFSFSNMLKQKIILLAISAVFFFVYAVVSVLISTLVDYSSAVWVVFAVLMILYLLLLAVAYIYSSYYYDKAYINFYSDFLVSKQGLINKYQYFVNYDDIKGITTTKYPWTGSGEIQFKVSGEQRVNNNQQQAKTSNTLSLGFISNIPAKDELVDLVLEQKQDFRQMDEIEENIDEYRKEDVMTSGPDLANNLTLTIVFSVIIFPLIALLPVTIPIVVWKNKRKSYHLKPYRILKKSGILFRKQQSIVFRKIDHINKSQGFLNKMFSNGNISVNTLASSGTEMTLENLSDYEKFYKKIQKIY